MARLVRLAATLLIQGSTMAVGSCLVTVLLLAGPAHPNDRAPAARSAGQTVSGRLESILSTATSADQNRGRGGGRGNQRDGDGGRQGNPGPRGGGPGQPEDRQRGADPPAGSVGPPDSRPGPPPATRERRDQDDRGRRDQDDRGRRDQDDRVGRDRDDRRGSNIYVLPRVYAPRYYGYGFGALGPRYYYYDRYSWYPPAYYGDPYALGYSDGYYDIGEIRLDVSPTFADVYVDGYYAGRVDDFDGVFQSMRLESGAHHIQIVAAGYFSLDFDVRIDPARKITYRGDLIRGRP